ncbi:MAG: T9SS type A sorting domain-containing protein [Bacteroidales bacterium]|nr:T9SS type A sorting domain-containing protein [Bacteroidales bacterium]
MKKSIYFSVSLLSILVFRFSLYSQQTTWEFKIKTPEYEYFNDVIQTQDNKIILTYTTILSAAGEDDIASVIQLSSEGNVLLENHFSHLNRDLYINNIFDSIDFLYLIGSYSNKDQQKTQAGIAFYKMDKNLNLLDSSFFDFPPSNRLFALHANVAKDEYLIGGSYYINPNSWGSPFFYTFSHEFDSVNAIIFPEVSQNGYFNKFKKLSTNDYWLAEIAQRKYYQLDSNLLLIEKHPNLTYLPGSIGIKWDSDTTFYSVGEIIKPQSNINLGYTRQFHPFDTTGSLSKHWNISDTVDFPAFRESIDFNNKDSIFIGATRNLSVQNPYFAQQASWFIILQTDSLLNVRWERFYGGDAYYVMGKIISTHDGGCLIGGWKYDYQNSTTNQTDVILLKLNSEGLLVGQNELQKSLLREAIVYPNPGSEAIQIRLAVQHPEALLELFDSQGKLVLSQQLHEKESRINTAQLPFGTYIYRLSAATGLNESGKWVKR